MKTSLKEELDYEFCDRLGYSYQPYAWLEDVCNDMIDEKLGITNL